MILPSWKTVARWLLVLPISVASSAVVFIAAQFLVVLGNGWVRGLDRAGLPIRGLLEIRTVLEIFALCAVLILPTALAVAFAGKWSWRSAAGWGVTVALAPAGAFVWNTSPAGSSALPHAFAIAAGLVLVVGSLLSLRRFRRPRAQLVANLAAFGLLLFPCLEAIAMATKDATPPQKLWTITLQKATWDDMNTGNEFEATRHLAFTKDKLVAVYESKSAPYQGSQPMSEDALVSLDLKDGSVQRENRLIRKWGFTPKLYSTQDGEIIVDDGNLIQLRGDLTETGRRFEFTQGMVDQMSPDGSTMAWETLPGVTLLDTSTLIPTTRHLNGSAPTSVNRTAILTDNIHWIRDYPKDTSFVTLIDVKGQRLLYHGECGGRPDFLTNDLVFVAGCGGVNLIDLNGRLVKHTKVAGNVRFAGVSQNGKRFAVVVNESRGDFPVVIYEHFILFDTETAQAIATVRTEHMPSYQSWSAFSADGSLFASGDATKLSLYQVP
jgi:hypothetical protein